MPRKKVRGRSKAAAKKAEQTVLSFRGVADPERDIYEGPQGLLCYDGREVLLCGAAGTGKSLAALAKIHVACSNFKGVRCLMVRKTRESLSESGMVTYENKVAGRDHHAVKRGGQRRLRQAYRYSNGSEIVIGGMDKPDKILSTEFDFIYVQEATELKEEDWETLTTRLRNNVAPIQQILADCNPSSPTHWLKRRCDAGRTRLIDSSHRHNPAYYTDDGELKEEGRAYLDMLRTSLTGVRMKRYLEGIWAQADGVVYPEWDPAVHVVQGRDIPGGEYNKDHDEWYPPPDWPRYWSIDFGHTHPFVCLFAAKDYEGRLWIYREIYMTGMLVEDHAARMKLLWNREAEHWAARRKLPKDATLKQLMPVNIIADPEDAEGRSTLERHLGLGTTAARKYVRLGIQLVSERLRLRDGMGPGKRRPMLVCVAGMTDRVDQVLVETKRPTSLVEEMGCYVWNPAKDMPVKEFDDANDSLRYLCTHLAVGMEGLWEAASEVPAAQSPRDIVLNPRPRLLYGVTARDRSAADRLFGKR